MREVKFRAWDGVGMHDWSWFKSKDVSWLESSGDSWVVMQFTGLKDKNGKEIWEGDIIELSASAYHDLNLKIKLANKGHRAEVLFIGGCFEWYIGNFHYALNELIPKTCDSEIKHMFLDALNCDHKGLTCEVLGNIYENPELVKP